MATELSMSSLSQLLTGQSHVASARRLGSPWPRPGSVVLARPLWAVPSCSLPELWPLWGQRYRGSLPCIPLLWMQLPGLEGTRNLDDAHME